MKPETPAEAKAREMIQRAKDKDAKKLADLRCRAAHGVVSRLAPHLTSLRALMAKPAMAQVAQVIRGPLENDLASFEALMLEANAVIETGTGEAKIDPKELASQISQSKKNMLLANQMLVTIAKMG